MGKWGGRGGRGSRGSRREFLTQHSTLHTSIASELLPQITLSIKFNNI
jgi:hypothetical protein